MTPSASPSSVTMQNRNRYTDSLKVLCILLSYPAKQAHTHWLPVSHPSLLSCKTAQTPWPVFHLSVFSSKTGTIYRTPCVSPLSLVLQKRSTQADYPCFIFLCFPAKQEQIHWLPVFHFPLFFCKTGTDTLTPCVSSSSILLKKTGTDTLTPCVSSSSILLQHRNRYTDSLCFILLYSSATQEQIHWPPVFHTPLVFCNTGTDTLTPCVSSPSFRLQHGNRHTDSLCFIPLFPSAKREQIHWLPVFHPPLSVCKIGRDTLTPCVSSPSFLPQNRNRYTDSLCFILPFPSAKQEQIHWLPVSSSPFLLQNRNRYTDSLFHPPLFF